MKNKKTLLIMILAFVLLLAGASVLYHFLSKYMDTNPLVTQEEGFSGPSQENISPGAANPENGSDSPDADDTQDSSDSPDTDNTQDGSDSPDTDDTQDGSGSPDADDAQDGSDSPDTDDTQDGSDSPDADDAQENSTEAATNPAPDFTVTDIDGNEVKLSDFMGKPVILNFWASWCGPCKSEMPDFDDAYAEYKDTIHFLMVNLTDGSRETVDIASAFVKEQGYSFPVYYDTLSDAALTYSVYSVPTTYFIDAAGNLIAQAQGAIDRETLQTGIEMIYSE